VTAVGGGVLHVTNGDAAVPLLRAAGVEGTILPWRDVLHDGPVPAVDAAELREVRAGFLRSQGWVGDGDRFADRDRLLEAADELVLWFEHDLYDQLQLAQVLTSSDAPARLVQTDDHLPEVDLAALAPVPVDDAERRFARRVWDAFRAPDPAGLQELAVDGDELPHLRTAVARLLEEYPSAANGLARSEQQALDAVAAGAAARLDAFAAAQAREEARFMGDTSFFALLERLEPLVGRHPELGTTERGRRVLAFEEQFVTRRWIGGVEIVPPTPRWRWDGVDRRLVTMLAA
jgi:uncharacterized protein DUF1835